MSNRFHSKFHRQNHHTYTSGTNPDAGHDPIASPQQPFLGDFVVSGQISANAPLSATAGFFSTNHTGLCAIGNYGIYGEGKFAGGKFLSTLGDGISAFGYDVGGDFYSNVRGVRSTGITYGILTTSPNVAISAVGNNIGGSFYSPATALFTGGNGINILNNRTGILKTPNASYGSYSLSNIVLDVNGDLLVDGNTVITGNLSALGNLTQLDTFLHVTSSIIVNNTGTDAAATIIQTGAYPILVCYDKDLSTSVPSFIVDGASNGWVALGVATPTAPLTIQKSTSSTQGNNQPQIRITDDGTTNKVSISTPITNFTRSYVGTESNTSFDIVTNSTAKITILNGGNVGINETNPGAKLSVSGSISGNSTFTNVGDIAGKSKLTVDGAISGASTLTIDNDILGKTKLTSYGAISGASTLTIDNDILGKTKTTSYGAISGASTLTIDSTSYFGNNLTVNGTISSNSTAIVTRLSAYDFVLNHPIPNDGNNATMFIGEMGDGTAGTIAGSLSGFITTYDELQNKYVIKTQFAALSQLSAIVIDQNANVGLGVASPATKLDVSGGVITTTNGTSDNWNSVYSNYQNSSSASISARHMLINAIDTIPRDRTMTGGTISVSSVYLTMFTPVYDLTISNCTLITGATTPSGITFARMGLYTWNESAGTGTLVARTAPDATIGAAANTAYSRAFNTTGSYPASYNLTAGTRYAFAFIFHAATPPNIQCVTGGNNASVNLPPVLAKALATQSDLPIAANTSFPNSAGNMFFGRLYN